MYFITKVSRMSDYWVGMADRASIILGIIGEKQHIF